MSPSQCAVLGSHASAGCQDFSLLGKAARASVHFILPSCGCLVLCKQCPESQVAHIVVAVLLASSQLPLSGNIRDIQVQN